ncbi:MAG TPA: hypothetical protein VG406_05535 [Isosphaeraceae bacterium]|jgi:hypothetical protein|nr:hypothetical protein [Isosphaeraceae bacterium]
MRALLAAVGVLAVVFAGVWETGRIRERIRERMRRERSARVLKTIRAIDALASLGSPRLQEIEKVLHFHFVMPHPPEDLRAWEGWTGADEPISGAKYLALRSGERPPYQAALVLDIRRDAMPSLTETRGGLGQADDSRIQCGTLGTGEAVTEWDYDRPWGTMGLWLSYFESDRRRGLTRAMFFFR